MPRLETIRGQGLHIIYSYKGQGVFAFLDSVHHAPAVAAWTTALICSLLLLGSERIYPLFYLPYLYA